jgi:hypothetical protein
MSVSYLFPVPCSLFPVPCSLFPVPFFCNELRAIKCYVYSLSITLKCEEVVKMLTGTVYYVIFLYITSKFIENLKQFKIQKLKTVSELKKIVPDFSIYIFTKSASLKKIG